MNTSTSLQRTYRYLRMAIASTVVVIAVAVIVATTRSSLLTSISAYYYTGARTLFVGALIAVALALLAISGRGPERILLDAAALFAPLIALVPTPIPGGLVGNSGPSCDAAANCVPALAREDIDVGVISYLILGSMVFALAVILRIARPSDADEGIAPFVTSVAIAAVVLLTVGLTWGLAHEAFLGWAHLLVTVSFFGLIVAVAIVAVVPQWAPPDAPDPSPWQKAVYWVVAVGLVIDIIILILVVAFDVEHPTVPPVLVGEFIALVLFSAFWTVQTIQKWNDTNPALAS